MNNFKPLLSSAIGNQPSFTKTIFVIIY